MTSREDQKLDEALDESFPASDPPANTVETGIRTADVVEPAGIEITDHRERRRFELTIDGETAFLAYERTPDTLTIVHTEVPVALRGRRLGDRLVEAAIATARSEGLRLVVICPFARAYLRKHGHDFGPSTL